MAVNTRAFPIIKILQNRGANTFVYDPMCDEQETKAFGFSHKSDFKGIDAIVLATDHKEFKAFDWKSIKKAMRGNALIDGRQMLKPSAARSMGFEYRGIGYV